MVAPPADTQTDGVNTNLPRRYIDLPATPARCGAGRARMRRARGRHQPFPDGVPHTEEPDPPSRLALPQVLRKARLWAPDYFCQSARARSAGAVSDGGCAALPSSIAFLASAIASAFLPLAASRRALVKWLK